MSRGYYNCIYGVISFQDGKSKVKVIMENYVEDLLTTHPVERSC